MELTKIIIPAIKFFFSIFVKKLKEKYMKQTEKKTTGNYFTLLGTRYDGDFQESYAKYTNEATQNTFEMWCLANLDILD